MEDIVCNSLNDLETVISKLRCYCSELVYRGLPDHSYSLQTRIEDKIRDKILANDAVRKMIQLFRNLLHKKGLANEIYKDHFQFSEPNNKNEWFMLCQAQHLGIPTLLMDWSIDWKKALFFSAFDLHNQKKSGSLWVFNVNGLTHNDDILDSKSIYCLDPYHYTGEPRIINPSFELGSQGFLAANRINYQDGRFFLTSLRDSIEPLENQGRFKSRLTKIIITPECKVDIWRNYSSPKEVPLALSGLQGVFEEKGNLFKIYDHNFFYGSIDEEILKTINSIRITEGFKVINT
jgi:hypothetical protein